MMMTLDQWKKKVIAYNTHIMEVLKKHPELSELHYGYEVFDGKIINEPLILFIGINPGSGDKTKKNRAIFKTKYISYLDVFDDNYKQDYINGYHLAEKTFRFFRDWTDEKIIDIFTNNVTKSNLFYLATDNETKLNAVLNHLKIKKEYHHKSMEFTVNLIKILKPKLVILEGKSVFNHLLAEWNHRENDWKNKQFTCVKDKNMNTTLIAYNRNITNKNRELFIKKLHTLLD